MDVSEFKKVLWESTREIGENMSNAFNPICEKNGLTMLQVRILVDLFHHQYHTISSLAESIHIAGANVSAMCKKLEGKGLLKRVRDEQDERVVRVVLTNKGAEIVHSIETELNEIISRYLELESRDTLENIITGLKKLNELLRQMGKS